MLFSAFKHWSLRGDWLIALELIAGFCSMKWLGVFLLPLDGMLVHRRSFPCNLLGFPQQFASTHLYSWVERGTVRVKCLAQEHNTVSPARAQTRTARSGDEPTDHQVTVPPNHYWMYIFKTLLFMLIFFRELLATCSGCKIHCLLVQG